MQIFASDLISDVTVAGTDGQCYQPQYATLLGDVSTMRYLSQHCRRKVIVKREIEFLHSWCCGDHWVSKVAFRTLVSLCAEERCRIGIATGF